MVTTTVSVYVPGTAPVTLGRRPYTVSDWLEPVPVPARSDPTGGPVLTARAVVVRWVADYNHRRPHSAIGYATPAAYAAQLTAMGDRLRVTGALRQSPIAPSAQGRQFERQTPASAG